MASPDLPLLTPTRRKSLASSTTQAVVGACPRPPLAALHEQEDQSFQPRSDLYQPQVCRQSGRVTRSKSRAVARQALEPSKQNSCGRIGLDAFLELTLPRPLSLATPCCGSSCGCGSGYTFADPIPGRLLGQLRLGPETSYLRFLHPSSIICLFFSSSFLSLFPLSFFLLFSLSFLLPRFCLFFSVYFLLGNSGILTLGLLSVTTACIGETGRSLRQGGFGFLKPCYVCGKELSYLAVGGDVSEKRLCQYHFLAQRRESVEWLERGACVRCHRPRDWGACEFTGIGPISTCMPC